MTGCIRFIHNIVILFIPLLKYRHVAEHFCTYERCEWNYAYYIMHKSNIHSHCPFRKINQLISLQSFYSLFWSSDKCSNYNFSVHLHLKYTLLRTKPPVCLTWKRKNNTSFISLCYYRLWLDTTASKLQSTFI